MFVRQELLDGQGDGLSLQGIEAIDGAGCHIASLVLVGFDDDTAAVQLEFVTIGVKD